jgi:glycosyltransferase involved in cell wall biosynthesis
VQRFALRPCAEEVDRVEAKERERTQYVLASKAELLIACLMTVLSRPAAAMRALALAWRCGRRSESAAVRHVIYWAEACVLYRWLRQRGAEHLHAHYGTNTAAIAMLCRVIGGPAYSFTCHGPEEFDSPRALSLGEKIKHASFVVAVSEFGRSQLLRWCTHAHWNKVQVVRCGVDELFLHAAHQPTPATPRLLSVGRLAEQKGQLLLIEAAGRLAAKGVAFELILVGDGPMRGELESLIAALGLHGRVILAGWKTARQIRDLMLESRALIMPSFAEGLPVVVMESLAVGRPVLSTYIAGIPELVEPGQSGFLTPAGSAAALAEVMEAVLATDAAEMDRLGRIGSARVREKHDAAREAGRLAKLFARSIRCEKAGVMAGEKRLETAESESMPAAPQLP